MTARGASTDVSPDVHGIPFAEVRVSEQSIEYVEAVNLVLERSSGDLRPTNLRVLTHLLVQFLRDCKGDIRHYETGDLRNISEFP